MLRFSPVSRSTEDPKITNIRYVKYIGMCRVVKNPGFGSPVEGDNMVDAKLKTRAAYLPNHLILQLRFLEDVC